MTNDHFPISESVPCHIPAAVNLRGQLQVPIDKLGHFIHLVSRWLPPIFAPSFIEETENLAQDICRVLKKSIKEIEKKRPSRGKGKSTP